MTLVDDALETIGAGYYAFATTAYVIPDEIRAKIRPGRVYIWELRAMDENNLPVATEQKSFEIRPRDQSPDKINPAQ